MRVHGDRARRAIGDEAGCIDIALQAVRRAEKLVDERRLRMIGGDEPIVRRIDPILATLAPGRGDITETPGREGRDPRVENGYMHCGPVDSGHFVKMVHNGIEYGLMQAYAEGFHILRHKESKELAEDQRYTLDLADVAEVWRRGSVVSSWLLDLTAGALATDGTLERFSAEIADSGEGRWTIEAVIEEAVPAQVLSAALYTRSARAMQKRSPSACCPRCASVSAGTTSFRSNSARFLPM
ncbi:MAG: 6-phosphogluconate dehydrogenase, decarboxylating (EC [uncultured Caballeronia sp.]|nr:MAG: 6-phosphogluconate dehydrogenase, decarboxylating (EC [uncultured Caballeronia sp.]